MLHGFLPFVGEVPTFLIYIVSEKKGSQFSVSLIHYPYLFAKGSARIHTPEQALEGYIQSTNTHDFRQVQPFLGKQAIYYFSDATCRTPMEICQYFENAWDLIKDEHYHISDVQWLHKSAQSAVCLYTYHYEGFLNEEFIEGSGRATNVFEKIEGNWVLVHEHLSSSVTS